MRRLGIFLTIFMLVLGMASVISAQDGEASAPDGTWLGTWPYTLPPNHHLNAYADGGPTTNLGNVYREFVELAPAFYFWADDSYEGILASEWGFTEDFTAYDVTFRDDIVWSNGDAFNADDVIATYALGRLVNWSQFTYIGAIEKIDEYTVRFHFSGEPSLLAEQLILREPIAARATYGEFADRALALFETEATRESEEWVALLTELREYRPDSYVATGAYTYDLSAVGDSYLVMSWQPNSIFSDTVKFGQIQLWAGETDSTTPLVLSGEIAHSTNVYPPTVVESFQESGLEIVTIPRGYGPAMLFNWNVSPWDQVEVRQAVALVIERDQNAFLTNGLGGTGTVYMSGILDGNVGAMMTEEAIAQLDHYEYDLDRASALLESVGFSRNSNGIWADADGNTISGEWLIPAEFADFAGASQDAIAQMNEFGFDITPRALPWAEVPENIRNNTFDLSVWSWGAASPFASRHFNNPIQRWTTDLDVATQPGMGIPMNEYPYNGGTVDLDALIDGINVGVDLDEHRTRASEVALIVNQTMPYIPLNVILSAEPFNTALISGLPSYDEPIMLNPTGRDHFIKYTIWNGILGPAN